jgi:hypothetical protein
MAERTGTTTSNVNFRAGPGTTHPVVMVVKAKTPVEIIGFQDDWLQVKIGDQTGYVHNKFIQLANQGVSEGFLVDKTKPAPPPAPAAPGEPAAAAAAPGDHAIANVPLEPPANLRLILTSPQPTGLEKMVANTWNKFGGLLTVLAQEFKIDPAVAVAVLTIESGGRGFGPDGRMLIRFENQIFFDQWGKRNPEKYQQHFAFNPEKRWLDHKWRPDPNADWREFHGNQAAEWEVFTFARTLHDTAAKLSISMGGPQIMGFNYSTCGYESVTQMFDAFNSGDRAQLIGFFDFVQGPSPNSRRVIALQSQDFETFASMYNGPGQAAKYGSLIRNVYDLYHKLKPG